MRDKLYAQWLTFIFILSSIFFFSLPTCSAGALDTASELAGIAVDAGMGALQESDQSIVDDLKHQLEADPSHKDELAEYINKTRPIIEAHKTSFPNWEASMVIAKKVPLVGDMLSSGISWYYFRDYRSALDKEANSAFLKRFATLREHSIDANQDILDICIDAGVNPNNEQPSQLESLAKLGHIVQLENRYESAARAMDDVLKAAQIDAKPVDDGNIFGLLDHPKAVAPKVEAKTSAQNTDKDKAKTQPAKEAPKEDVQKQSATNQQEWNRLVQEKNAIDGAIGQTASRINNHLNSHPDFYSAPNLKDEAETLVNRALKAQAQAQHLTNIDSAKRERLVHLFALEAARARGLYDGVADNLRGGDFHVGFKNGMQASNAFDKENASFQP